MILRSLIVVVVLVAAGCGEGAAPTGEAGPSPDGSREGAASGAEAKVVGDASVGDALEPARGGFAAVGRYDDLDPLGLPGDELTLLARAAGDRLQAAVEVASEQQKAGSGGSVPRVIVIGSRPDLISDDLAEQLGLPVEWVSLAHPGMQPCELLAWTPAIIAAAPDVIVVTCSYRDVYGPLAVGPEPGGEPELALQLVTSLLTPAELTANGMRLDRTGGVRRGLVLEADRPLELDTDEWTATWITQHATVSAPAVGRQVAALHGVGRGRHAAIAQALIGDSLARFAEAGIELLVFEAPLHPATRTLHDRSIRNEFLEGLAPALISSRATLVLEPQLGPFSASEFDDLSRLGSAGRRRAEQQIMRRIRKAVERSRSR